MLAGLLALAGCSGLILAPSEPELPQQALELSEIRTFEGELSSATGCPLRYRLYRPAEEVSSAPAFAQASALVVLGHGFLRSQQRMAELAEAIAAAGIPVATVDFCNMRFWDGRHQQNGLDMMALSRHLGAGDGDGAPRVIYAGFSAGALAALIAARNDPNALGVVTLDLVDAQGIGEHAARGLGTPLIGLAGEPTNCNANDNARAVFAATHQAQMTLIPGAGHCDFEAPTDALCELVCADPDQADAQTTTQLREQIRRKTLEAIRSLSRASASAAASGSGQAFLAARG